MIDFLHKWRLDHIVFGWLLIVGFGAGAWLVVRDIHAAALLGYVLQAVYWLGREIRDIEIKARLKLPQEWWKAWDLALWMRPEYRDNRLDLGLPVVVNFFLVCLSIVIT